MIGRLFISVIIFVLFSTYCYDCIQVIPDRTAIKYVNEKYGNVTATVRRSSRRGDYVLNIDLYTKKRIDNNMTVKFVVYEYRGKYNNLFEWNFKACDLILHDVLIGTTIRRAGVTHCPIPTGFISGKNMTYNQDVPLDIDFILPFEQGKVDFIVKYEPADEIMLCVEVYFHIIRKKGKIVG